MKAVVVREVGDASVLKVETDYPKPIISEEGQQVLVRNVYSGLNFIDTYYRKGLYKKELPFVAGGEGGGIVEEISSSSSTDLKVGDTVVYKSFGSYAEYTLVPIDKCIKVPPDGLSLEMALASMVQGLTAHYLTTDACAGLIQPGHGWCLIYAVGSGTTQWAAQMAKIQGYKVIGTTSKTKEEKAKACGACDELIVLDTAEGKTYSNYQSVDIVAKVMEITGGVGCHAILDGVGASTADISVACLARRGIWISFGNASGTVPPISLLSLVPKSAFVTRPNLADYVATREELEKRCNDVFGWLTSKKLQITIDQVFSLDDVQDGHVYLESGKSQGKILFKI